VLDVARCGDRSTMPAVDAEAIVLFSGGQDSTTCLAWALRRFARVRTLSFDYGQRHRVELRAAAALAERAGVYEHRQLTVSSLAELGGNALNDAGAIDARDLDTGLPSTFVPGRNLLFLTLAAAWGYQLGVRDLVTGVCQTDYSGYPDCREDTMHAVAESLRLGMDAPLHIHTPLMHLSKAESIELARREGGWELLAYSHSCYAGAVPPCGACPACELRAKGFAEAGMADPLLERLRAEGA